MALFLDYVRCLLALRISTSRRLRHWKTPDRPHSELYLRYRPRTLEAEQAGQYGEPQWPIQ